ncbi:MAG TPA: hypothetical protein VLZ83_04235 [Edaphocola sp.]|nr:hypothetical protein [Edaphocola sp.]
MNTKILMTASAVFYGIIGIGLTFLPKEIAEYLGTDISQNSLLIFQLLGAGYWGFAMLNWMTRNSLIGGIYSRPLVAGNLAHFLISSLTLIKIAFKAENSVGIILVLTIIYSAFTLFFGYAFIANPRKISNKE